MLILGRTKKKKKKKTDVEGGRRQGRFKIFCTLKFWPRLRKQYPPDDEQQCTTPISDVCRQEFVCCGVARAIASPDRESRGHMIIIIYTTQ